MKKKGFTLVELLGVIVVLAIIALIAVPTIIGVIDKSRKKALQNSGYGLVEAGTLYYAHYQNSKTVRFDIKENEVITKDGKEFTYKGRVKEGTVLINKNGKVTICINDGKYAAYKNFDYNKVILVDNKTCNVPENSNIVYLDSEPTIDTSCEDLIARIETLENKVTEQKQEMNQYVSELNTKNNILTTEIATIKQSNISIDKIYPVGSIYISTSKVNPSTLFPGTTWEIYTENRTLMGIGTSKEAGVTGGSNSVTLTTNNLPSHAHSIPNLSGSTTWSGEHTHGIPALTGWTNSTGNHHHVVYSNDQPWYLNPTNGTASTATVGDTKTLSRNGITSDAGDHYHSILTDASNTGAGGNHAHTVTTNASTTGATGLGTSINVQNPYITVYIWKRIS